MAFSSALTASLNLTQCAAWYSQPSHWDVPGANDVALSCCVIDHWPRQAAGRDPEFTHHGGFVYDRLGHCSQRNRRTGVAHCVMTGAEVRARPELLVSRHHVTPGGMQVGGLGVGCGRT